VIAYKHHLNYHPNFLDTSQANACIENLIKQNNDGNYLASFIFIAYTGWIYWYIKQTTQDNDFLLLFIDKI
jgi:hypothetical protein